MNDRIFNVKTQRRKDAKETGTFPDDWGNCFVPNGKSFLFFSAPLRLCAFALILFLLACSVLPISLNAADTSNPLYQNDFSKAEVGKLPEEMLLLDGGFAVQDVSGNKVLQLPGAPL